MKKEKSVLAVDYKERIMWFDGSITPKIASRFSRVIGKLNKLKTEPIVFYIRGPGGDPWSTFDMMNDITQSRSPVACVAHDYVASGCFTLTQAGVLRAALPGTKFVFHSAVGLSRANKVGIEQTQQELIDWVERLKLIDYVQFFWFSMRGRPVEMIQEMIKSDYVLSLPMAKKFKLMDAYFKKADFFKDRKRIREVIKKKKKI